MSHVSIIILTLTFCVFLGCQPTKTDVPDAAAKPNATEEEKSVKGGPAETGDPKRILELEPGWELVPKAEYTASQTPGEVIIKARGEHPATNYEAKLVQSMLRIWPPQYLLARHKTGDMGGAAMTPFEVTASFKATDFVPQVRVTDAAGAHDIKVDQARD